MIQLQQLIRQKQIHAVRAASLPQQKFVLRSLYAQKLASGEFNLWRDGEAFLGFMEGFLELLNKSKDGQMPGTSEEEYLVATSQELVFVVLQAIKSMHYRGYAQVLALQIAQSQNYYARNFISPEFFKDLFATDDDLTSCQIVSNLLAMWPDEVWAAGAWDQIKRVDIAQTIEKTASSFWQEQDMAVELLQQILDVASTFALQLHGTAYGCSDSKKEQVLAEMRQIYDVVLEACVNSSQLEPFISTYLVILAQTLRIEVHFDDTICQYAMQCLGVMQAFDLLRSNIANLITDDMFWFRLRAFTSAQFLLLADSIIDAVLEADNAYISAKFGTVLEQFARQGCSTFLIDLAFEPWAAVVLGVEQLRKILHVVQTVERKANLLTDEYWMRLRQLERAL